MNDRWYSIMNGQSGELGDRFEICPRKPPKADSPASKFHLTSLARAVYIFCELGIFESGTDNQFRFGTRLYLPGRAAGKGVRHGEGS